MSVHKRISRGSLRALGLSSDKLKMIGIAGAPPPRAGMIQLKAVLDELPKAEDFLKTKELNAKKAKRDNELRNNLEELLNSEANYLQDLRFTVKEFATPLRGVMDRDTHFDVFANLAQLEMLHAQLETDLSDARHAVTEGKPSEVAALVARLRRDILEGGNNGMRQLWVSTKLLLRCIVDSCPS